MSFDLYLVASDKRPIDPEMLASWAEAQPHVTASLVSDGMRLAYDNGDTGVRFTIDYSVGDRPGDDVETALSLNLNYFRPSFFAYEAMPVVVELAEKFDLLIQDPQSDEEAPRPCDVGALIEGWVASNESSVPAVAKAGGTDDIYFLPRDKADALWRYNFSRAALQAEVGHDAFVPLVFVLAPEGGRECVTAAVWAEAIPTLFPPVDYVMLVKIRKGLMGLKKTKTVEIVPAGEVFDAIGDALTPYGEDGAMRILTEERAAAAAASFDRIEGRPLSGAFTQVPYDGFVDVDLPSRR